MKSISFLTLFIFFFSGPAFTQASHKPLSDLSEVYSHALRGQMLKAIELLENIPSDELSEADKEKALRFHKRFVDQNEKFVANTNDPEIIELYSLFRKYWKNVMLEEVDPEEADKKLIESTTKFIQRYFVPKSKYDEIKDDLYDLFLQYFESKGLYGNAMGKTGKLYDLYLWKEQDLKRYDVSLPEKTVEVKVVFMKDFISNGWTHYATLGRSYSGGWAKKDRLFCVEKAYDQNSENFRVSYLAHEGQHFADYEDYPKLKQVDLEYRAKLTELVLADKTINRLLRNFTNNAHPDAAYAHGFANYQVIDNLGDRLSLSSDSLLNVPNEHISSDEINQTARQLLLDHSHMLKQAGADTVTSVLVPTIKN